MGMRVTEDGRIYISKFKTSEDLIFRMATNSNRGKFLFI